MTAAAGAFRLDLITEPGEFAGLADEWDRLAAHAGDRALFMSHRWIARAWQRHQDRRWRTMHIVTIRDGGELVLAAPFVRVADGYGTSTLAFLDLLTPLYNDILVVPDGRSGPAKQALWEHLRQRRLIRAIKLSWVPSDAAVLPLPDQARAEPSRATVARYLDLSAFPDGHSYFRSRSAKTRENFGRFIRLLERQGRVGFRRIELGPALEVAIGWIFEHKRAWVRERFGLSAWLLTPGTEEFFRDVAAAEAGRGGAAVTALELDGRTISATLAFRHGQTVYLSKQAYEPGWGEISLGWLATHKVVMDACDAGLKTADLMIGGDQWKVRLGGLPLPVAFYRISFGWWRR